MARLRALLPLLIVGLLSSTAFAGLITPVKMSQLDMFPWGSSQPFSSAVCKNWLYVVGSVKTRGTDPNVLVFDISNPAAPTVTNEGIYYSTHAEDCDIVDGRLYAAVWGSGTFVIDTHNSGQVDLESYIFVDNHDWRIKVAGNRAYVMADDGMYVVDVTDPHNPVILGSYTALTYPWAVGVRDNIVYCGDDHKVVALDVSDPAHITQTAQVNVGAWVNRIEPQGDYLYVGTSDGTASTFTILDITQPWNPKRIQVGGVNQGQISGEVGCSDMWMAGNTVFMAVSNGLLRMDVSNPVTPKVKSPLMGATGGGLSISCNGRYAYTTGITSNNIHGWLTVWQIYDADPDNVAPSVWRKFSPTDAGWDVQLHGDLLPSAASPSWPVTSGSETYASMSDGALHINDNSTAVGSKVLWTRQWGACQSKGTTVLFRARCASQSGTNLGNFVLRDGRYTGTFTLKPGSFSAQQYQSFAIDGSNWHTYRITTKNNTFKVYVDESQTPALSGNLAALQSPNLYHDEISIGADSEGGTQDIYIDWLYTSVEGDFAPPPGTASQTPNVAVDVFDQIGTGSLSGIDISTAQAFFSRDGGATWISTPATCSGADADERVRITAASVPFNQLSADQNKIKFTISDMNGNSGASPVFSVRIMPDTEPPAAVTNFTAVPGATKVTLSWTNPTASDFLGTWIVYKTTGYPTGPMDGTFLIDQSGAPGSAGSYTHNTSTSGVTYYYAAYAHDSSNFSTAALGSANPGTAVLNVKPAALGGITIDGNPSDWNLSEFTTCVWGGRTNPGDYALVGFDGGAPRYANHVYSLPNSPADHVAKVYCRHDATYQYFLVRCDDSDMWYNNPVSSNWANDCIELYIDPSHNHGSAALTQPGSSTSDIQLVIDANNQKNVYCVTSGYATQVLAGVTSAVVRDGTGWWLEMRIQKSALDPDMPSNGTFGVEFCFRDNDNNNDSTQSTVYNWADTTLGAGFPNKIPDKWANADVPSLYPGAPSGVTVAPYTGSLSKLSCSWSGASGASKYRCAIGTTPGLTNIADWADTTSTQMTRSGLSLAENTTYYFSVKAGNDYDYWSSAANSGGVKVAPAVSIQDAKALGNGGPTDVKALRGKIVSGVFADCFYVQEPLWPFGIRVVPVAPVLVGQTLDLAGKMAGSGVERYLNVSGNALETSDPE